MYFNILFIEKIFYETRDVFEIWKRGNKDIKCTLTFCADENNLWNQRCFWNLPPCFLWFSKKLCWYSTFRIWTLIQKYELYYKCRYKRKCKKYLCTWCIYFWWSFFPLHSPLHSSRENVFENPKSQIGTWARFPKCVRSHIVVFISASCLHKNYDERESF